MQNTGQGGPWEAKYIVFIGLYILYCIGVFLISKYKIGMTQFGKYFSQNQFWFYWWTNFLLDLATICTLATIQIGDMCGQLHMDPISQNYDSLLLNFLRFFDLIIPSIVLIFLLVRRKYFMAEKGETKFFHDKSFLFFFFLMLRLLLLETAVFLRTYWIYIFVYTWITRGLSLMIYQLSPSYATWVSILLVEIFSFFFLSLILRRVFIIRLNNFFKLPTTDETYELEWETKIFFFHFIDFLLIG